MRWIVVALCLMFSAPLGYAQDTLDESNAAFANQMDQDADLDFAYGAAEAAQEQADSLAQENADLRACLALPPRPIGYDPDAMARVLYHCP